MNVNAADKGRRVRVLETFRGFVRDADFPGWGVATDAELRAHLHRPAPGLEGVITSVESHGSNPWTRYSVRFDDGTSTSGACPGTDVEFVR